MKKNAHAVYKVRVYCILLSLLTKNILYIYSSLFCCCKNYIPQKKIRLKEKRTENKENAVLGIR